MIGLPRVKNTCVIPVYRYKSITELHKPEAAVPVDIVSLEEQVYLLLGRHEPKMINEASVELRERQAATGELVEDLESIEEVEVSVHDKTQFALLDQSLLVDELHECRDQVFFYLILY
jgi:hypothetical protein